VVPWYVLQPTLLAVTRLPFTLAKPANNSQRQTICTAAPQPTVGMKFGALGCPAAAPACISRWQHLQTPISGKCFTAQHHSQQLMRAVIAWGVLSP
jgi:hypothetical protein